MDTTIITAIMSSVTTIVVTVIGLFQAKKAKESSEYKKLQEELLAEKEQRRIQKEKEDEDRLIAIENSVTSMQTDLKNLERKVSKLAETDLSTIEEQLSHLHILQSDNFEYIQSLSNVVLTIGETLNESDVIEESCKEKMLTSISVHRKNGDALHKKLYKIIV